MSITIVSEITHFLNRRAGWYSTKQIMDGLPSELKNAYTKASLRRITQRALEKLVQDNVILRHNIQNKYHRKTFAFSEWKQIADYAKKINLEFPLEREGDLSRFLHWQMQLDLRNIPIVDDKTSY